MQPRARNAGGGPAAGGREGRILPRSLKLLEEVAAPWFCCGPVALAAPSNSHLLERNNRGTPAASYQKLENTKLPLRLSLSATSCLTLYRKNVKMVRASHTLQGVAHVALTSLDAGTACI